RRLADALGAAGQAPARREEPLPAAGDLQKPDWWDAEFPTLRLADVGGMEEVKRRLNVAFIGPLRNPDVLRAYGKALRGGLLLYGPPGCGKTYIARATAGEIGARFVAIGLADVLSMWLGESERHLHELFEAARRNAPCVLFFDEIDAIGQRRSQRRYSAGRNMVNQLLAEMDGVDRDNAGVFVLGATNHPWDVDAALLRPGRFDRMALVLPPDRSARAAILGHHLRGRPVDGVDLERLAGRTEDFSGADLAHLCDTATEYALEESLAGAGIRSVTGRDFDRALGEVRPSTRAWFETARSFVLFANDGGLYDDLQAYMRARKLL
ncbi:MAG TPA: ATP-binding protein, partial [Candidatus Dormibacteraeota bacterium]|nr:ATP-binding protein [Candidatus Dormibacteraeota bacterium]